MYPLNLGHRHHRPGEKQAPMMLHLRVRLLSIRTPFLTRACCLHLFKRDPRVLRTGGSGPDLGRKASSRLGSLIRHPFVCWVRLLAKLKGVRRSNQLLHAAICASIASKLRETPRFGRVSRCTPFSFPKGQVCATLCLLRFWGAQGWTIVLTGRNLLFLTQPEITLQEWLSQDFMLESVAAPTISYFGIVI